MIADQLSRPVLGALAIAGCLVLTDGAAANPGAGAPPPPLPSPGAALLDDLDALHARLEIHVAYRAGRESWLDVGVHPLPPRPRR